MPFLSRGGKGKEWMFETSDVLDWERDQAIRNIVGNLDTVTEEELKRRKLAAETSMLEIDLAKKMGEVAPLEDMELAWRDAVLEFKTRIRLLPSRCSIQLIGLTNESEIKSILRDEVDQSLTVLSEYNADVDDEE